MGRERVVLLQVAERRLRAAKRMGRDRWTLTARVDTDLRRLLLLLGVHWPNPHPGVVRPRLGP